MKKIGFVTPWYGDNIKGGAEADLRNLVANMKKRNIEVEILTTCVADSVSDWSKNAYKQGTTIEHGIPVRRFPVDQRDVFSFVYANSKLIQGQYVLSDEDEKRFVENSINSRALYQYIHAHADEYEAFGYIPYLFGTTYFGVMKCPEKSFLIPCFHDEPYAYLRVFKRTYSKVAGMAFHAAAEKNLAKRLYDTQNMVLKVVGSGMDTDITYDAERFRKKYQIAEPFILYAGRKDAGKNVDTLIKYFAKYKENTKTDLKLLLLGGGTVDIPQSMKGQILDLGFVDKQDKYDAYAAAEFLCQPSKNESFSLVLMESWLCERPVLVCEDCQVTTDFVKEANGGLYFKNYDDFSRTLEYLINQKEIAEQMGQNGKQYVLEHFSWDKVIKSYCDLIKEITSEENL